VAFKRLPYFPAAMSRNARIGLVVAALVVAVVAFAVAQPGDDEDSEPATTTTQTQAETGTPSETEAEPAPPPEPQVTRLSLRDGEVQGGAKEIEVDRGDAVRIVVTSDAPDELHLHGYDIEREAAPGQPARFRFHADAEGEFVLESHTAEHAGKEPVVARLLVGPS
jgi:FtsP/CotA-like multicopper oxidase with cupredoxin domain